MGVYKSIFSRRKTTSPPQHEEKTTPYTPKNHPFHQNPKQIHGRIEARNQEAKEAAIRHRAPHRQPQTKGQQPRVHVQEPRRAVGQGLRDHRQGREIPQQEKHENEELECAEMIGDYAVVLDDEKERVFEDDGDEVCEEGGAKWNAIAQDFEEWFMGNTSTHW